MAVKRACQVVKKVTAQVLKVDFEFVDDLGSGETVSAVSSVVYSPTGELSGGGIASGTKVQVTLSNGTAPMTITAEDTDADTFTRASHGMSDGDMVHLVEDKDASATSCLPGGVDTETQYWIVGSATNTFQLSACEGGDAIDITSAATGTYKVAKDYVVTVTATTSGSQTLIGEGIVQLRD